MPDLYSLRPNSRSSALNRLNLLKHKRIERKHSINGQWTGIVHVASCKTSRRHYAARNERRRNFVSKSHSIEKFSFELESALSEELHQLFALSCSYVALMWKHFSLFILSALLCSLNDSSLTRNHFTLEMILLSFVFLKYFWHRLEAIRMTMLCCMLGSSRPGNYFRREAKTLINFSWNGIKIQSENCKV